MIQTILHIVSVVFLLSLAFGLGWKYARNYYTDMSDEEWDEIYRARGMGQGDSAADDGGPNFH